jgi:hypothetical protein
MKQNTIKLVQWNTKETRVVSHLENDKNLALNYSGVKGACSQSSYVSLATNHNL